MAEINCTDVVEADPDALWEQFKSTRASASYGLVELTSKALFGAEARRAIREPLLMLTKTEQELADLLERDPEMVAVFREMMGGAQKRATALRAAAEMLDMAGARLRVALCAAPEDAGTADA
ncbi:hypothetical protein NMQ14_03325 [Methyloversatilis sp. XJ19-13]|uniref:hypothetical protein n=1 Tax=Methyloversatilis sp. XJ19-13 TaxID=2963430 RepID=UPI00211C7275|nr:hypothetical protein [Methyloversatilis sp. XJ19-13]MCQ9373276.1 hypothetical protein [Methyloversatilis sp. XJ19-13]